MTTILVQLVRLQIYRAELLEPEGCEKLAPKKPERKKAKPRNGSRALLNLDRANKLFPSESIHDAISPWGSFLEFEKGLSLDAKAPHPHVLIEGENLLALQYLRSTHYQKIDFIYIDPPYNTGNTGFTYKDKFTLNGDTHGPWTEFMRQRLVLAKDLMAKNGIITISIDDREYVQLKILSDSIFGEANYIGTLVWHSKYTVANDARFFSRQHEYILVYAKKRSLARIGRLPRTEKSNAAYKNPDNDPRGPWKATPIHAKSGSLSATYEYTFPNGRLWSPPAGRYPRYSRTRLRELYDDGRLWFGKDGKASVSAKTFLSEVSDITPGTVLGYELVGHTHSANEQLASLIGKGSFDNPKPVELITTLIRLCSSSPRAIILDFFAGSGTTAEAVARLNQEDGGKRHAIICTSNENDICRSVTYSRLRAVHTGEHAENKQAQAIPVPLRYFTLRTEKVSNSFESHAMLATGLPVMEKIGPRNAATVLSDGRNYAFVIRHLSDEVLDRLKKIPKNTLSMVLSSSPIAKKLTLMGIDNIWEVQ